VCGVTKTTTAVQLSFGLARGGYKVLLVGVDEQGNATFSVLGKQETERTLFDVPTGGTTVAAVVPSTLRGNLWRGGTRPTDTSSAHRMRRSDGGAASRAAVAQELERRHMAFQPTP
jgi:Mrp family chromosome partitioning ATPase